MNLDTWKKAVDEHISILDQTIEDRNTLKQSIEEHLSQFFEWEEIDYNRDFTVITLSWAYGESPVIKADKISDLKMDWIINADYDDNANRIVTVEIHPWGVEET